MKKNFYAKVLTLTLATSMVQVPAMATDLIDNNHAVKEETENNEEVKAEAPVVAVAEEVKAEAPVEEAVEEVKAEAPVEETAEEVKTETQVAQVVEEVKVEAPEAETVEETEAEAPETEATEEATEEAKAEEENEAVEHKFGAWDFDEEKETFVRSCADCDATEESTEPAEVTTLLAEIEVAKGDSEAVKALTQKAVADGVITEAVAETIDATMQVSVLDAADTAVTAADLKADGYTGVLDTSAENNESTSIFYKIDGDTLYFKAATGSDGKMPDYVNTTDEEEKMRYGATGWYNNDYTKVVFDSSITGIGKYTLVNRNNIEEITIGNPTATVVTDAVLFSEQNTKNALTINAYSTIQTTDGWIRGANSKKIRKNNSADTNGVFDTVTMVYTDTGAIPTEITALESAGSASAIGTTDLFKSIATLSSMDETVESGKLSNYIIDIGLSDEKKTELIEKAKGYYDEVAEDLHLETGVYPELVKAFPDDSAMFMYTYPDSDGERTLYVYADEGQSGTIGSLEGSGYYTIDYAKVGSTIGKLVVSEDINKLPEYMLVTKNNLTDIYTYNETVKIPRIIWANNNVEWTAKGTTLHVHDTAAVDANFISTIFVEKDGTITSTNSADSVFKDCNGEYNGYTGTAGKSVTIRISTYEADEFENDWKNILKKSSISSAQVALIKEAYDSLGTYSKNQLARDILEGTTTYKERIESLYGDAFKCGDNVTYTYSKGTLTITGTGDMYTYTDDNKAPWDGEAVKNVVIDDAVTNVNAIPTDAVIHASINSGAYQYAKENNAQFKTDKLRVLCIGNSHTADYTRFLSNVVADLKNSGLTADIDIQTATIGSIGAYSGRNSNSAATYKSQLAALEANAGAYSQLKNNTYDLIIVQDYLESTVEGTDTFVPGMESYIAKIKEIVSGTPEIAWFADWVDLRSAGQDNNNVFDATGANSPIQNKSREEAYAKSLANIAAMEESESVNKPDFIIHMSTMKQNIMSSYLGKTENEDTNYSLIEVDRTHKTPELGRYFAASAAMSDICNHYGAVIGNSALNVANALTVANGPVETGTNTDYQGAVDDKVLAIIKEAISSPLSYTASKYTEDPAVKVKEVLDAYIAENPTEITVSMGKDEICSKLNAALTTAGITDYTVSESDVTVKDITVGDKTYKSGVVSIHSGYTFRTVAFGDEEAPAYSGIIYDSGWTSGGVADTTGEATATWEMVKNANGMFTLKINKYGSGSNSGLVKSSRVSDANDPNVVYNYNRLPWTSYLNKIEKVEIGDGVQLENLTLFNLTNCKEIVFGDNVTLGNEVFYLNANGIKENVDCNIYFTGKTTINSNLMVDSTKDTILGAIRVDDATKGQINVYYNVEKTELPATNEAANKVVTATNAANSKNAIFTDTKLIGDDTKQAIVIHPIVKVDAVDATCTATGNEEYYKSNVNEDELYSDADGKTPTTLADVTTAALNHDITYTANGEVITETCRRGDVNKTYTVSIAPDKTSLLGGGDVTLTVAGVPTGATVEVKNGDTALTAEADGTYTYKVTLANADGKHTFTLNVTVGGVTATTTCEVSVTGTKDLAYKVEHYKENLDGTYTLADTDNLTADLDTEVTAEAKTTYAHYVADTENENAVPEGRVTLPEENGEVLTLKLYYKLDSHTVTFNTDGGTEVTAQTVKHGKLAEKPSTDPVKSRYRFLGWYTDESLTTAFDFSKDITEDTTVYAGWKKKSSSSSSDTSAPTYGVSTGKTENGTISVTPAKAEAGETVTIKATPDSGYQLDKVTVKDKNNSNVKLTKVSDNEYTFTMPSGKVSVDATFAQKDAVDDNQNNAGETSKVIKLQIGSRIVTVDNEAVIYDVAPVIRNDRTLVPIRIVTETLGGKVDWNGVTKEVTLTIDGKEIKMTVGKTLEKYGVAPVIIDGRTFVPVRFVADELGATVAWDDATKTVTITKIEK